MALNTRKLPADERARARRWGGCVLTLMLVGAVALFLSDDHSSASVDTGIDALASAIESRRPADFDSAKDALIAAQAGWIADDYAAFALHANAQIALRVAPLGLGVGAATEHASDLDYWTLLSQAKCAEARRWVDHEERLGRLTQSRARLMRRLASDLAVALAE